MVIVSASLRKQIESIKEIVGNHSDSDIYNALKESHMNLDEAVDKLLHQDTFHEVRKRRVKKEMNSQSTEYSNQVEPRMRNDYINQGPRLHSDRNGYINQGQKLHSDRNDYINQGQRLHSDRNGRRGGYTRRGISREFRVVRDNRVNQNSAREPVSSTQVTSSDAPRRVSNVRERSAYMGSNNQRHSSGQYFKNRNGGSDVRPKMVQSTNYNTRKEHPKENTSSATITDSQASVTKQQNEPVGVYASASDPVHVPTNDSRPAVGAIRREIGVVGGRRQSSESGQKQSHQQNVSNLNSVLGSSSATVQSTGITNTVPQKDQSHRNAVESGTINAAGTRIGNHFSNRFNQQPTGQKGALPSKEWKPKTTQKRSVPTHGVIGSTVKSTTDQTDTSKSVERETEELQNKLTEINIHDTQKVIIAQSIRVPEFERCRLTFGTIGMESDIINNPSSEFHSADVAEEAVVVEPVEASPSNNHINDFDDQVRTSASSSPGEPSEDPLPINNDSGEGSNTENYADVTLVHDNSSFTTSKSEQLQRSIESPNFSAYDPQPVYEMPYFRHSVDDAVRVPGIPSNQEALSSHTTNMIPNSSVAMMQQQQQQQQQQAQVAQMYPQLSHYTMPYRQFIPPMYVPPMVPGYSGNPGYPHLSNGNSYVLMPGGGSHVPGNGLKYDFQQFKPFPAGSPTGFGGLVSPTGYAMNPPGVVGGPTGLDDSSRIKYKDNNLYVPNPQAETSGVWIQNHREHPGMQSTPYFNMQSLATHPSFNTAASPQSSQMQFPGMYPPQASAIPNAHHLGGGNIGVGVAPPPPGPQVGGYQQQPQMNHLNWGTTNF